MSATADETPRLFVTGFECGIHMGPPIVHLVEGFEQRGETLAAALQAIDQFNEPGRTFLLDLQAAMARLVAADADSRLAWHDPDPVARPPKSRRDAGAPMRAPQRQPAPPTRPAHVERIALHRVADRLRQAGATLPAPAATSTVEGAVVSGLCIALCLVDAEIDILGRDAELAAMKATLIGAEVEAWEQQRTALREQACEGDALDAARYRWLRDHDWLKNGLVRTLFEGRSIFQYVGKGLDAAVDALRGKA